MGATRGVAFSPLELDEGNAAVIFDDSASFTQPPPPEFELPVDSVVGIQISGELTPNQVVLTCSFFDENDVRSQYRGWVVLTGNGLTGFCAPPDGDGGYRVRPALTAEGSVDIDAIGIAAIPRFEPAQAERS